MSPYLHHKHTYSIAQQDYYVEIAHTDQVNQPLIIGLHGYGSNERQMESLVTLSLDRPHTYISLRAFEELQGGGYGWYPVRFTKDIQPVVDVNKVQVALSRAAGFIAQAAEQYNTRPEAVYVVGYSMGGSMSAMLALLHPEVAQGFVVMAGNVHKELLPFARSGAAFGDKALFLGHGTRDPLISLEQIEGLAQFASARGFDVTLNCYDIPHVVGRQEREDVSKWLNTLLANH